MEKLASTWMTGNCTSAAATAAKSLQLCPTLCDPTDGSPPGSPVPRILQARTLEWVAISFSNAWKWKVKVKSLSCIRLFATPWTEAYQAPPSMGFSGQEYWRGVPLPSPSEAWWATIYRVAKSQIQLSNWAHSQWKPIWGFMSKKVSTAEKDRSWKNIFKSHIQQTTDLWTIHKYTQQPGKSHKHNIEKRGQAKQSMNCTVVLINNTKSDKLVHGVRS